ncbi:MAG: PRC-barrel domain-containing protein [Patescibacteria group bacterium]
MQKSYREFIGTPIRDRLSKALLGKVSDLVVSPINGEVLALFTRKDKRWLLPTVDVSKVVADIVWVENAEALAAPDDIVRIADVIKLNISIFGNKVFTVGRQYLGEVVDFRFETNGWVLTKIDVAKRILTIPTQQKLINSSQIVRIKASEVTVRDAVVQTKVRATQQEANAPDFASAVFKTKQCR